MFHDFIKKEKRREKKNHFKQILIYTNNTKIKFQTTSAFSFGTFNLGSALVD